MTLENACQTGFPPISRTCQDLYVLLIAHHFHSDRNSEAATYLSDFNRIKMSHRKLDADEVCNNEDCTPSVVQFTSPALVHRQLPGLRAAPWWNTDSHTAVPYDFIKDITDRYANIRDEVLAVSADSSVSSWGMNQDLRLSTNPSWDPLTSWEAVALHANGKWIDTSCEIFPITCDILKSHDEEFRKLFDRDSYLQRIGEDLVDRDYTEIPTLGIKLYKVWPSAGIKNHTGSPGRLVNSIALSTPQNPPSTLTVGDVTRAWTEGKFYTFDDSFFHSVDNPHSVQDRIVLAIVTMHPDLM